MDRQQAQRVLALPPGRFTSEELAHAFRQMVRQHHPDVNGNEHETAMRLINVARDLLRQYADEPEPVVAPPPPKPAVFDKWARKEEPEPEDAYSQADSGLLRRVRQGRT